ncbi:MAG: ATP-binding protein [Cyclobacteriaceae bacterium]
MGTEQLNIVRGELMDLFDNAPCGYHSIDERGYFVSANRTLLQWLGYEKEELIGKLRFTDVVDEKYLPIVENISSMAKGHLDIELKKKGGGALPVMLSAITRDESKELDRSVLYSTIDNSRYKQALERIKYLDQELEAFSYSISHDLRAPLRSIDGYSKILQEDYAGRLDDEGRRVLNVIMNNARRMGKLIDDLLEFGRLGRKSIQRSRLNMTAMVNTIVQELLLQESGRRIDINVGELHPALADPDMMRQVWSNLLENAIKYTGKKEVATIRVRSYKTEEGEIHYEVRDNGDGFDMKYVGKLFGVFQRLHKIQDFAGTGVGLAIVKRIISRHSGRVWAEGALHVGAVFYFTIPIEDENP